MLKFINIAAGRDLNSLRNPLNLRVLTASLLLIIFFAGYTPQSSGSNNLAPQSSLAGTIRFAAIGDYGVSNSNELAVTNLVKSWNPNFIITLGDNNYPDGAASTIDMRIGQYFHDYISPYTGSYTPGGSTNRFFPALGNHDWIASGALPYLNYFSLPNNERYYTFTQGPVEFFAMDSDSHEPDGISVTSAQAAWLHQRLTASSATWKIVYFHHPPYSSGSTHGSNTALQWPFQQWGASAVLSGHEHQYERILRDGIPFIVNGLGGNSAYPFGTPVAGSQVRYNTTHGAQLIEADANHITFKFYSIANGSTLVDSYTINSTGATATPAATNTTIPNQTPTKTLTPTPIPTVTKTPTPISGSTVTLNAIADSYVSGTSPSSNFGSSTTLRTDGSPIQRSYLRFDVPIPSANIISATLRIFANTAVSTGYAVHTTTGTWAETTLNFSNAPTYGSSVGNSGAISANSWTQVDVTSAVTGTGQYTFVIDTTSGTATSFSSREGANAPQLVITTGGGGGGSSSTATNTPTNTQVNTPTVTLTRTATSTPISGNTVTLNAVADSYVYSSSSGTNFGLSPTLRTDASPIQRSYLRFTVPSLSGSVTSATLRIYANTAVSTGYTLHSTTGSWSEATINFSNAPTFGNSLGNSGAISANSWTQVNVTSVVTGAGQYNFVIDTTSSTATSLSSREGANAPQLIINTGSGGLLAIAAATHTPTDTIILAPMMSALTSIPTETSTDIPTLTPTRTTTAIPTATAIWTNTPIPTATRTMTPIPTLTATRTMTAIPTLTPTPTNTPTPTSTHTPTQDPCQPPYGSGGKPPQCK